MDVESKIKEYSNRVSELKSEISKVIVGQEDVLEQVLLAILCSGHVLLEGVPGLGKTLLVKTLAQCLALKFSRIQFTPDLMPADIVGTNIIAEGEHGRREFRFQPGPIFGNVILADEINRATPKTQSALLEAMQERRVTVADRTHTLEAPFFVLATQNPIEMEGTYPLPEAQLDRFFFKVLVSPSKREELVRVLKRTTGGEHPEPRKVMSGAQMVELHEFVRQIPAGEHVSDYAARVVLGTNPEAAEARDIAKKYLRYGSSPRGAQALVLAAKACALMKGRVQVGIEDVKAIALPSLRHRLILNFEGQAEGTPPDTIIEEVIKETPERPSKVDRLTAKS
ncbi:MAG: MoxR family ATPase [Planctomycetota bacterium]